MTNGAVYRVEILPSALKELAELPAKVRRRADERIQGLAHNPRPPGCKKLKGEEDQYRVALGAYRIVYRIQDAVLLVTVLRVQHRKDAYD